MLCSNVRVKSKFRVELAGPKALSECCPISRSVELEAIEGSWNYLQSLWHFLSWMDWGLFVVLFIDGGLMRQQHFMLNYVNGVPEDEWVYRYSILGSFPFRSHLVYYAAMTHAYS